MNNNTDKIKLISSNKTISSSYSMNATPISQVISYKCPRVTLPENLTRNLNRDNVTKKANRNLGQIIFVEDSGLLHIMSSCKLTKALLDPNHNAPA